MALRFAVFADHCGAQLGIAGRLVALQAQQAGVQRDVAQLVRDSDIGLSVHSSDPSMLGSFPVKVMEYIGAGIPSIVLPCSEAGMEVAERGLGWSYDPSDWKLASDCIASLLGSACKLQEAKHRVFSQRLQYTRDRQADHFVSVVTSALTG
jgi:hypothetical protein